MKSRPRNWRQSRQLCKTSGLGDLVSIESYSEWIFLKNTISKLSIADEYFIGLKRDGQNGQWRWLSNKTTSYLPWATGEPNLDGKCATMYKDYLRNYGKYNDLDCTNIPIRPGYICEFPVDSCNQEGMSCTFHIYFKRLFSTFFNRTSYPRSDDPYCP